MTGQLAIIAQIPMTQQFLPVLPAGSPHGAQSELALHELGQDPEVLPPDEVLPPLDDPEEPELLESTGAAEAMGCAELVEVAAGAGAPASRSIGYP
jgi:hypothetical protein